MLFLFLENLAISTPVIENINRPYIETYFLNNISKEYTVIGVDSSINILSTSVITFITEE